MFGFSSLTCSDCSWIDSKDKNKYGEYYCTKERDYVDGSSHTCRYFDPNFYVMTAYCNIKGLSYNCNELITMINYRNNYMRYNDTGIEFLHDYNNIGPKLAFRIQADMYRYDIVKDMEETYILPILNMINENRFEEAQNSYIEMIEKLKIRYGYNSKDENVIKKSYK